MNRVFIAAGTAAALTIVACTDATLGTEPRPLPPPPPVAASSLRGTVDLVAGTLTFEHVRAAPNASTPASAVSAAIYGDQGITVRIYNSPVIVTSPSAPGKKTYAADVGVRNLLPHTIGDEQGGAAPDDTTGIFVFVSGGPTVRATSSPCLPACSVTVANAHGVLAFNAQGQQYWYWNDRLTAAGGLQDTTLTRRSWSFEADTQVTNFSFDVLVSAAWPSPYETRWKVEFPGDSLPHTTSEPDWARTTILGRETVALDPAASGSILLTAPAGGSQYFGRRDSLGTTSDAYMEARVRLNVATLGPETAFAIDDDSRFVAVGVSGMSVGFINSTFGFIGTPVTTSTGTFRTYRLRKFGADSAQLLVDGTRVTSLPYTSFSTRLFTYSLFAFGAPGTGYPPSSVAGNSSTWDYVIYEIGATQP